MKLNKYQYIIHQRTMALLEERLSQPSKQDTFEMSNETCAVKYITEDGRVRLDIDFDEFKILWAQAQYHIDLCEAIFKLPDEKRKRIPESIRHILNMFFRDHHALMEAENIIRMNPLFDYRKNK